MRGDCRNDTELTSPMTVGSPDKVEERQVGNDRYQREWNGDRHADQTPYEPGSMVRCPMTSQLAKFRNQDGTLKIR